MHFFGPLSYLVYLAGAVVTDEDVSCRQVTMDVTFHGQVAHSTGYLAGKCQQLRR